MIDLMHAGQKAEIVTKLGGKAEMTLLQDSLLSIDLSKRSKMEIRWYDTTGNDTIIALVNTVYAPAGDSRIRFFDTIWTKNHSIVSNPICKIQSCCIGTEKDSNKTTSLS